MGQMKIELDSSIPSAAWNDARCAIVISKYRQLCKVMPTRSILDLVRKPTIDMWQWEDYEVLLRSQCCNLSLYDCTVTDPGVTDKSTDGQRIKACTYLADQSVAYFMHIYACS